MSSYSGRFISNINIKNDDHIKNDKLTLKQLKTHNKNYDCLVAVNGKIYNITKYKKYLESIDKKKNLGIKCGYSYNNVNEDNLFKPDILDYKDYHVGYVKYYYLMIILKIIFQLVLAIILYYIYLYTNNVYILIPLIFYIFYLLYKVYYNYSQKQRVINSRLKEINPNLVNSNRSSRFSDKITKELNKDINNMLYGVDNIEDI
jgi:hypothetical protein